MDVRPCVRRWLLVAGGLLSVSPAQAGTLWSDNFNYSPVLSGGLDANESGYSSQRSGSRAGDIVLRSAKIQHAVTGTALSLLDHSDVLRSGAIRFLNSSATARFDLASGAFGSEILASGGFEVSFDWTPSDSTDSDWIAFSAGIRSATADVNTEFTDGETDMGILLRNNGGVQARDALGITDSGSFTPGVTSRKVVLRFAFNSFGDGSTVVMNAWVGGKQVVFDRSQKWGANGANSGRCFITLENRNTNPQLIDNLSISTFDEDGDRLPDEWEGRFGLSSVPGSGALGDNGWLGDPDGDGYPNHAELRFGTNPVVSDNLAGKLTREVWFGTQGEKVSDLLSHPRLFPAADVIGLNDGFVSPSDFADNFGERVRGWITAPATGDYTFWISGDNQCELWLSTTDSKFDRNLIASVPEWTAPQQWDKFPSQRSVPVHLNAGQRYFVECLHKEGAYADSLAVAWQTPGGVAEVIPPQFLTPYAGESADQDMDELPDAWEVATFGSTASGATDNPDGDYAPNWEEYLNGSDPLTGDSNVGYWKIERWYDMPYDSVPELVGDRDFYGEPTTVSKLPKPEADFGVPYAGTRVRGYVQVEETAEYFFWISARSAGDLFLSTDETPYRKQRIAYLGPDGGGGNGIRSDSANLWDVYASQMSEPIRLEAGRKYYLEVNHQNGHQPVSHVQVAWAKSDGLRSLVPVRNMSSYIGLPGDVDDDALPDVWETANGLDATDNGYGDLAKQGERGDFDEDGLTNREEFLAGTSPSSADTDGDGLSDRDEVKTYGTNPTVSDSGAEQMVQVVAPGSVAELGNKWTATADGVMTSSFRGSGTWSFSVPEAGFWVVQVEGKLVGDLLWQEIVPVDISIDGDFIARDTMEFLNRAPGSMRVITPWLAAGNHDIRLFVDNYAARRSLEITAIKVVRPGGLDLDNDGRSDAVETRLASNNRLLPGTIVETCISPAFVEGVARASDSVEFRRNHEGVGSAIRHKDSFWGKEIARIQGVRQEQARTLMQTPGVDRSVAGSEVAISEGPGRGTWFVKVPLEANQATGYTAFFENGSVADSGVLVWRPINLLEEQQVTIPVHSTLLMSAWDDESDNSRLKFTIGNELREIRATEALPWQFDQAGDLVVSMWHQRSGETVSFTVHVRDASLPQNLSVTENRYRTVSLPGVAPNLVLDSHEAVGIGTLESTSTGGSQVELAGREPGEHRMAVRLAEGAPILDLEKVKVIGISDGMRNSTTTVTPAGEGIYLVRNPLLLTNLPAGATIRINIFAGGVTFLDGTTTKTLTIADFDENGVYMLEMLKPDERLGAACHTITIFDADGNVILE